MKIHIVISNPTEWYKQPGSRLIRKVDKCSGSHVSVMVESYSGLSVYESVWPRTCKITHAKWSRHNVFVKSYVFDVKEGTEWEILEFLDAQVGTPYSVPQLALILADYVLPGNYRNINDLASLICSELAARVLISFFNAKFEECLDTIGVKDIEVECGKIINSK